MSTLEADKMFSVKAVYTQSGFSCEVGALKVTAIVPIRERDESVWFIVRSGNKMLYRINSKFIEIIKYKEG